MPSNCACGCGLRVSYGGVFRNGHQAAGTSRDPKGKDQAANHRKKLKTHTQRRADIEAYLLEHGLTGILSTSERASIDKDIATDRWLFDDHHDERLHALDDLVFADEFCCGCIGETTTMRTLDEEALHWLAALVGESSALSRQIIGSG